MISRSLDYYKEFENQFNISLEPIALQPIDIDLRKPKDWNCVGLW